MAIRLVKLLDDLIEILARRRNERTGTHKHKCWKCGHVWRHPDETTVPGAHFCTSCGERNLMKYFGPEEPKGDLYDDDGRRSDRSAGTLPEGPGPHPKNS